MEQRTCEPEAKDIEELARQFVFVDRLAAEHLGRALARDQSDLDAMQELLDRGVPAKDETWQLQCLGVVLGMLLVDTLEGFDWVIVEDDYGRDPAIRYHATSLVLFPLTMISKRVEDGQRVNVPELFTQICARATEIAGEIGPA